MSRSQDVIRVRKRLVASANSASSSGAVFRLFCATKSCRIRRRTDLDPESHSCRSDVSCDMATSRFDEVMTSVHATYRLNAATHRHTYQHRKHASTKDQTERTTLHEKCKSVLRRTDQPLVVIRARIRISDHFPLPSSLQNRGF